MLNSCPHWRKENRSYCQFGINPISFSLFFRNLLPLSSHMAHLCSRVSHRNSMRLPQSPSISLWVTEALLLCSWRARARESVTRSRSNHRHIKNSSLVLIPLTHTHIACFRICFTCYESISPAVEPGIEFRSWPFTLLSCDFIPQQANKLQWRLNAAKAPMKPATVQEEFIPFQQLMNICSALVVTALWSVVLWVQC